MEVTVEQLIEKLQSLPKGAIVEVLKTYTSGYQTCSEFVPLEGVDEYSDGFYILDYREDIYKDKEKYGDRYGKVFVQFGQD
jgi:hypothetical protein